MRAHWDVIIEPLLSLLRPAVIIEIGADLGQTTHELLEFCATHDATLHTIDPLPQFDVAAWQARYGSRLVAHRSPSLDVLPCLGRYEAVLIDGDHNWYTVFNELKMIERRSAEIPQPFPVVMLHDVGWPYGRRDLYYDPHRIPEAYRHPHERMGMQPGSSELRESGGFNRHLFNANFENGPRNGVLTAIEDFLKEAHEAPELVEIPGFHGLAILRPPEFKQRHPSAAAFLDTLVLPAHMKRYAMQLEFARLESEMRFMHAMDLIGEAAAVIPPGHAFILVDDAQLETELIPGRRSIPFLERDGQYWGAPADDATAIRELERLRRTGASFIVFAWPAFWWFQHYPEFNAYLRSTFQPALESARLVVFDLRCESNPKTSLSATAKS